jgi:DNA-binding CsgD family transcriptional regulator
MNRRPTIASEAIRLNAMEYCILKEIAQGKQTKQIASTVKLRKTTVEDYIERLRLKFNAQSRTHLVARAFAQGVITPQDIETGGELAH